MVNSWITSIPTLCDIYNRSGDAVTHKYVTATGRSLPRLLTEYLDAGWGEAMGY